MPVSGFTAEGVQRAAETDVGLGAALPVVLRNQTWRMPADPSRARAHDGALQMEMLGLHTTLHRTHRVTGSERLEVEAGSFECIRVAIEDRTDASASPIPSIAWIAPEVGLVRMEIGGGPPHGASYEPVSTRLGAERATRR